MKGRHVIIKNHGAYSNDVCPLCLVDKFLYLNLSLILLKHLLGFHVEFFSSILFPFSLIFCEHQIDIHLFYQTFIQIHPRRPLELLYFFPFLFLLTHLGF